MTDDDVREQLIEMRRYIQYHGIMIGECVAWNKLKRAFNVGGNDDEERKWVEERIRERARQRRSTT